MPEPAELFQYDTPELGSPVLSQEIRNNFEALARTFFTEDAAVPSTTVARTGQLRVNAEDPANVKLQIFLSGAWRTILSNLQAAVALPTKLIFEFVAPSAMWTINHNLGSKPLVSVLDTNGFQLESVSALPEPVTIASLTAADLGGVPPGPAFAVRSGIILPFTGTIAASQGVVTVPPAGPASFAVDFAISGVPITGGTITVPAAAPPGPIGGSPILGGNAFSLVTPLDVLITTAAPIVAGALDVVLDLVRTPRPGQYIAEHTSDNTVVITHPAPVAGVAILIG